MKYNFKIIIKPCVNYNTCSAEIFVTTDEYDRAGNGVIVRQKHIEKFTLCEAAEKVAEQTALNLRQKLEELCKQELSKYPNAKP